jgi:hypothetical protein
MADSRMPAGACFAGPMRAQDPVDADVIGAAAELADGLACPSFIRNRAESPRPEECVKHVKAKLLDCSPARCRRNSCYVLQIACAIPADPRSR